MLRGKVLRGALAAVAALGLLTAYAVPASAVTLNYSQSGGFLFDLLNVPPSPTATATGFIGGLELFGAVTDPLGPPAGTAPLNTYRDIGWGCGANASNCAPAGVAVAGSSPFDASNAPDRSSLRIDTVRGASDVILTPPGSLPALYTGGFTGITAPFDAGPTGGLISDDGSWVFLSQLLHRNQPIDADAKTLDMAIIRTNLRLSSSPQFNDLNSDVNIFFTETLNNPGGPCPAGNPAGTFCDDYFFFSVGTFATTTFVHNGTTYRLDFDLFTDDPNVVILGNQVFTGDGDTNDLWVIYRMTKVPQPSSLLLLGAGLVGGSLGYRLVRRRQAPSA